jgi:glycosyltransferase involved in cell wall biosynthesis
MNRKIIQFITTYPLNNEPVIKNRLVPFIKIAIKQGYKVQLISPDLKPFVIESELFQHICSPEKIAKPKAFIKRALFEYNQANRLLKLARKNVVEHRMVTIPSMFLLFNVRILIKSNFTIDVRDLTWEYLPDNSLLNKLIKKSFRHVAFKMLTLAEYINVTNETEFEYFEQSKNISNSRLSLITNGVSQEQFDKLTSLQQVVTKRPVVSYIGNVGIAQNLTTLIDAAENLKHVDFIIVGSGTDYERINKYLMSKKITNLNLTGRLEWEEVVEIYEKSDILFAQLTENFAGAMPSKLYEYLSTGKYVLYGGGMQAKKMLSHFDNNAVINPNSSEEITEKLQEILDNRLHLNTSDFNKSEIRKKYIREHAVENYFMKLRG